MLGTFHYGGANTLIFNVDGDNAVNSFVMCSKIDWNMVVTDVLGTVVGNVVWECVGLLIVQTFRDRLS